MEIVLYVIGGLAAFVVIMAIAEPHRILGEEKFKTKKVGSTYWGTYAGQPTEADETLKTIELKKPTRREKPVYGSNTYVLGRGVSMRGG